MCVCICVCVCENYENFWLVHYYLEKYFFSIYLVNFTY